MDKYCSVPWLGQDSILRENVKELEPAAHHHDAFVLNSDSIEAQNHRRVESVAGFTASPCSARSSPSLHSFISVA